MAAKVLEKLDEQLNCDICLDTYTDPRLLRCFHIFCTECIAKLVVRDHIGRLALYGCPTCRQVTPIPPNGVRGLQSAFQANVLLEIRDELLKAKDEIPSHEPEVRGGGEGTRAEAQTSSKPDKQFCSEHGGQELELYCETCGVLICYRCGVKGGKHRDHDYSSLSEAFERYKEEIMPALKPMENQLKTVNAALVQLDTRSGEIADQRAAIEASITDSIRRLHEVLSIRKTELLNQLHSIAPDTPNPTAEDGVTFTAPPGTVEACMNFGTVFSPGSPDPSRCHATGEGLEVAVVGEMSTAIMEAVNFNGEPCEESIGSLICELVSEMTGVMVDGSLERRGESSKYEISYQPTVKGRHQLHVKVEDQHIRGSPFPVAVKLPIEKLGIPILTIGGVEGPYGITFNQKGEIVVAEYNGECVSIFSPSGEKLRSIGEHGHLPGSFHSLCDVAMDNEGNILAIDGFRLQKFTGQGQFLTSVETYAMGLLHNGNAKVYMGDGEHRLQVMNPSDLSVSRLFGEHGSGPGEFDIPRDIACDSTGNLYVADTNNHRIQILTAEGKFLRMFGKYGQGRGELDQPMSIAIDTSDRVYVGDYNNRISVFTSEGEFLTSFGQKGEGPGEFNQPRGLAVDASGLVYVCDTNNNRIQVF